MTNGEFETTKKQRGNPEDTRMHISKTNKEKIMVLKYRLNQNVKGKHHKADDVIAHLLKVLDDFSKLREEYFQLKQIVESNETRDQI